MAITDPIKPLFILNKHPENMGESMITLTPDDYNKGSGVVLIDAKNDAQAISSFLNEYKDSPQTLRSYAKEIERLLLWCIHVGKVNVSSLRRDHFLKYQQFLKKPTPQKIWCGANVGRQKKDGSINNAWRPFVKGLGDSSVNTALKIVDSFLNYLVQTRYLTGNPLAVDRRRKKRHSLKPRIIDRYLELDEIHAVLDALAEHPAHAILFYYYFTLAYVFLKQQTTT